MMLVMAIVFGAMAIIAGQKYLERQSSRLREAQVVAKAAPTRTVVVAALPFRFGTELTKQHLREVPWPEGAVPKGVFGKVDEIIDGKTRRVALAAVEENEPILGAKITGPGQRGSLAAVIEAGMKAATVRVNDVNGVAGFVLAGERVDVLLIRNLEKGEAYADVLLQNVKVLAVDQNADERADKPALVKAVTLEVTTGEAQKLALAGTVGSLALALRSAGVAGIESSRRVSIEDLSRPAPAPPQPVLTSAAEPVRELSRTATVGVIRGMKRQEYSVPLKVADPQREIGTASVARPQS
jgi:pilus assembly protein CpaB